MRLSFMLAGVQKSGTTTLDAYLRAHPSIVMATPKETHFFDREEGVNWRAPDYGALHTHYAEPAGRLAGEATPVTLYWIPAHYRVFRYNPDMKFILVFRDPVARAFSHWRMMRRLGHEPLGFAEAIRDGRSRVLDGPGPVGLHRRFSYVERGFYARQLAQMQQLFPPENFLYLAHAELERDPDGVLGACARFLGLEPFAPAPPLRLNQSPGRKVPAATDSDFLRDLYAPDQARFEAMTGIALTPEGE